MVRDVEKLLGRLIGEDIEIIVCMASDLRYVKVDIGQIEQLLINLAVNARDAMPNGGRLTMRSKMCCSMKRMSAWRMPSSRRATICD